MSQEADRKRIEEQLAQLEKRRLELCRELAITDHPEIAEPIREIEGRIYAVHRVEARMAEGLSKAEARRIEALQKKREGLAAKKAELDAKRAEVQGQLDALDRELSELGEDREATFHRERNQALEALVIALGTHAPAFQSASVEIATLIPELTARMPEVQTVAERLATHGPTPTPPGARSLATSSGTEPAPSDMTSDAAPETAATPDVPVTAMAASPEPSESTEPPAEAVASPAPESPAPVEA